ncbi:MAG TPA: glycosyltransferase family 2 protein [Capsulimonadaceae bacterium]
MRAIPAVSVILPVYNAAPYLRQAVDSILAQSFADFELLVFDDGSTDASRAILESYNDPRMVIHRSDVNKGYVEWLNKGIEEAKGEFIARMDADDISHPERFAIQMSYMKSHPSVGICGSNATVFGSKSFTMRQPTTVASIQCRLLFGSAFVHPSVMIRRESLMDNCLRYGAFAPCEDLELWRKASELFPCANINQSLLKYRMHSGSSSFGGRGSIMRKMIDDNWLSHLGINATMDEIALHEWLNNPVGDQMVEAEAWLLKLRAINRESSLYPTAAFEREIIFQFRRVCLAPAGSGLRKYKFFLQSRILSDSFLASHEKAALVASFLANPVTARLFA